MRELLFLNGNAEHGNRDMSVEGDIHKVGEYHRTGDIDQRVLL